VEGDKGDQECEEKESERQAEEEAEGYDEDEEEEERRRRQLLKQQSAGVDFGFQYQYPEQVSLVITVSSFALFYYDGFFPMHVLVFGFWDLVATILSHHTLSSSPSYSPSSAAWPQVRAVQCVPSYAYNKPRPLLFLLLLLLLFLLSFYYIYRFHLMRRPCSEIFALFFWLDFN